MPVVSRSASRTLFASRDGIASVAAFCDRVVAVVDGIETTFRGARARSRAFAWVRAERARRGF